MNVSAHAEISAPSPTTTTLNKIAKSMSNTLRMMFKSIQKNSNTTSDLINSSELTAGIQESQSMDLQLTLEAASVLANIDTSSSKSISTALASLDANIGWLDDDYVQTVDQDTIVYDSEWQTLTKVTGGDLEYTTDENIFDPNKSQQMES